MYGSRPVIGICPLYDEKRDSYWMLPGYMKMLEAAGAIPLMLPLTTEAGMLDYFLQPATVSSSPAARMYPRRCTARRSWPCAA